MRYRNKQITKALLTAKGLLHKAAQPVAQVAAVLNPYMDCTDIEGVEGREHEDMRCSIFALMADAYLLEGNIPLAAKWYRRASQISPGEHAPIFAEIVCKQQLAEYYQDALRVLQEHRDRWKEKPRMTRFFLRLGLLFNGEARQLARSEKRNLRFLREQAPPQASQAA